jgi:hypothetical protein
VHRQGDVVDQGDLVGRIDGAGVERIGGGVRGFEGVGRVPAPRPQPVDAQPAGDYHQPGLGIVDGGHVGAGQGVERFLHHVLGVTQVQQDAERDVEHPAPVGLPQRVDDRVVLTGRSGVGCGHRGSDRGGPEDVCVGRLCYAFLRMPSCQISLSIDGLALGVATAIAERT